MDFSKFGLQLDYYTRKNFNARYLKIGKVTKGLFILQAMAPVPVPVTESSTGPGTGDRAWYCAKSCSGRPYIRPTSNLVCNY